LRRRDEISGNAITAAACIHASLKARPLRVGQRPLNRGRGGRGFVPINPAYAEWVNRLGCERFSACPRGWAMAEGDTLQNIHRTETAV